MLRKNKTKSLYDKAIEKKNEKIEKERLYKDLKLDKDKNTIVFDKDKNTGIKILNFILTNSVIMFQATQYQNTKQKTIRTQEFDPSTIVNGNSFFQSFKC